MLLLIYTLKLLFLVFNPSHASIETFPPETAPLKSGVILCSLQQLAVPRERSLFSCLSYRPEDENTKFSPTYTP
jgi:hypothetical protein